MKSTTGSISNAKKKNRGQWGHHPCLVSQKIRKYGECLFVLIYAKGEVYSDFTQDIKGEPMPNLYNM